MKIRKYMNEDIKMSKLEILIIWRYENMERRKYKYMKREKYKNMENMER